MMYISKRLSHAAHQSGLVCHRQAAYERKLIRGKAFHLFSSEDFAITDMEMFS